MPYFKFQYGAMSVVPYIPYAVGALESKAAEHMARAITDKAKYYGRKIWSNLGKRKRTVGQPLGATYNTPKRSKSTPSMSKKQRRRFFKRRRRRRGPLRRAKKKIYKSRGSSITTRYNSYSHGPFPDVNRQWFRTMNLNVPMTNATANTAAAKAILLNSYTPCGWDATRKPMYWDTLAIANLYEEYCVIKTKVKMQVHLPQNSSPSAIYFGYLVSDQASLDITNLSTLAQAKENGGVFVKRVHEETTKACTRTISMSIYPWKHLDMRSWKTEENCAAYNASPSKVLYLHFFMLNCSSALAVNNGQQCSVIIDQLVNLHGNQRFQSRS